MEGKQALGTPSTKKFTALAKLDAQEASVALAPRPTLQNSVPATANAPPSSAVIDCSKLISHCSRLISHLQIQAIVYAFGQNSIFRAVQLVYESTPGGMISFYCDILSHYCNNISLYGNIISLYGNIISICGDINHIPCAFEYEIRSPLYRITCDLISYHPM